MLTGILVPTSGRCGSAASSRSRERTHAGPPDRRGLRPAQPAVVGPAAARVVPAARRDPPAADAGLASRGWPSASQLLEMEPFLDTPVRQLSLGQRMRGEVDGGAAALPRAAGPGRADDRPGRPEQGAAARLPGAASAPSAAPPCCSPPTTWPTSSGSATGSWSSTTAGSPSTATLPGLVAPGRRRAGARRRPGRARTAADRRTGHDPARGGGRRPAPAPRVPHGGHDGGRGGRRGLRPGRAARPGDHEPDIEDVVRRLYLE